jgi:uncharacterized protein (DUF1499 family)
VGWTTGAALVLAVLVAAAVASAGLGYRAGWWGLRPTFTILQISVAGALAVVALALAGLILALVARSWPGVAAAVLAGLIAGGAAAVPLGMRRTAAAVPPIHDITTDTANPPEFVALRAARVASPNGAAYGGPEVAAQQRAGYPDLAPLTVALPPDRAIARLESAARRLGWDVAAAVPAEGRLEATATTRWFAFKDDVVVRAMPVPGGSRIDVRSASRVGKSDLGVNAARIRTLLAAAGVPD